MAITIDDIQKQIVQQLQTTSESASLDAQVLLAHLVEKPRSWILAHPEYSINEQQYQKFIPAIERLIQGEPLPYVIGYWEFYGLEFSLTNKVLIPRPETELMVERAIHWLELNPHRRRVIDVGTGSGCIGISIAKHLPDIRLLMTDISAPALKVARLNLERYGLEDKAEVLRSDLLSQVSSPYSYDLLCANLPYVPTNTLNTLPVVKNEPRLALDGGSDGLKLIKRLLKAAKGVLDPGGLILLEIDPSQSDKIIQLAHKHFPKARTRILKDLAERDRCVEIETKYSIFHLCQRADWVKCRKSGKYQADSLLVEGFIHCSKSSQIVDVANRYYKDVKDMVVLTINPESLNCEIRWERAGQEFYPHVYGAINLDAVSSVAEIRPDDDGIYRRITGLIE